MVNAAFAEEKKKIYFQEKKHCSLYAQNMYLKQTETVAQKPRYLLYRGMPIVSNVLEIYFLVWSVSNFALFTGGYDEPEYHPGGRVCRSLLRIIFL